MRNTNEKSLKEVIEEMLRIQRLKKKLTEVRIRESWEKIMGPTIAMRTLDIQVKNKTLLLKINSAPLKHELSFSKEKIIKLLNDELGEKAIEEVTIL